MDLEVLLRGLVIGFSFAAPVGPIQPNAGMSAGVSCTSTLPRPAPFSPASWQRGRPLLRDGAP